MTDNQFLVQTALEVLRLELKHAGRSDARSEFEVTQETLKFLAGKQVTVEASGAVVVTAIDQVEAE